jgi:hypothetical protein
MHKKTAKKIKKLEKKKTPKASMFYCRLHRAVHSKTLIPFSICYNYAAFTFSLPVRN